MNGSLLHRMTLLQYPALCFDFRSFIGSPYVYGEGFETGQGFAEVTGDGVTTLEERRLRLGEGRQEMCRKPMMFAKFCDNQVGMDTAAAAAKETNSVSNTIELKNWRQRWLTGAPKQTKYTPLFMQHVISGVVHGMEVPPQAVPTRARSTTAVVT